MNVLENHSKQKENDEKLEKLLNEEKAKLNASDADKKVMDFPIVDEIEKQGPDGLIKANRQVAVNNYTGTLEVISTPEDNIDFDALELDEQQQSDIDNLAEEAIIKSNKMITKESIQKEIIDSFDFLSDEDKKTFSDVIDRVRNKEEFSVYAALPVSIKNFINFQIGGNRNHGIAERNRYARCFVENFVNQMRLSFSVDVMSELFDEKKKEELRKLAEEAVSGYLANEKERYALYAKEADLMEQNDPNGENSSKVALLRSITQAYEDAYHLTPIIKDVNNRRGKYKFKPIQVEKFTKECESFNIKYERSDYDIKDIGGTLPIIQRLIDTDLATAKFILLAFMKFTMNYKPAVIPEHVFMSTFVSTLYQSDTATSEGDIEIINELKKGLKELAGLL